MSFELLGHVMGDVRVVVAGHCLCLMDSRWTVHWCRVMWPRILFDRCERTLELPRRLRHRIL